MAVKKVPAFPSIFLAALLGVVFAVFFQRPAILKFVGEFQGGQGFAILKGVWTVLASGFKAATGNPTVDELLSRGGMASMLNTIWLIICAMVFGASLEKTGLLQVLVRAILFFAKGTASLITATVLSCIGINIIAADQYISIVLPGRMFRAEFERRGLAPENLSRTLEDAGTITSPLIPLVAIIYGIFNVKIRRLTEQEIAALNKA